MGEFEDDSFFIDDIDSKSEIAGANGDVEHISDASCNPARSLPSVDTPSSLASSCSSSSSSIPASKPLKKKKKKRKLSLLTQDPASSNTNCEGVRDNLPANAPPLQPPKQKKKRAKTTPVDLPPMTATEKVGHIKLIHRALKKTQKLSIAKLSRKRKEENQVGSPQSSTAVQDLEIYKSLDIDGLTNQAWEMHEAKTKPTLSDLLTPRARELCLLLLHSPAVKKSFQEMEEKRIKEYQHKMYLKNKKKTSKEEVPKDKGDAKLTEKLYKLREGDVVQGLVDGVETFGVFVDFWAKKQQYRGLIHISEVTGGKIDNLKHYFDIGDPVRAVVLKIDKENLRVSLTLQKKYYPLGDPGWVVASNRFRKSDGTTVSAIKPGAMTLESTFVTSLKAAAPVSDIVEKKKKKSQLVKLLAMAKGVSKKRMGQRQRHELLTGLYGEAAEAEQKTANKKEVASLPRKPFKPVGRAEQKRRKRLREDGVKADNNLSAEGPSDAHIKSTNHSENPSQPSTNTKPKSSSKPTKALPKKVVPQINEPVEKLHPSWAAKRNEGAVPEFKGKRVVFG